MRSSSRPFASALLTACLLVGGAYALARPLGFEFWGPPDQSAWLEQERARDAELRAKIAATHERELAKARVAQALLDERLTLVQAAARFRDINRSRADSPWEQFRARFPGDSDDERHCRQAADALRGFGAESVARARTLEAELQAHLDGGTLRLPE
jgi:hypothetical protein